MSTRISVALQPPLDALFPQAPTNEFQTESIHVLDVIRELCRDAAAAQAQVLRGEALSPYVHVFLNGRQVAPGAADSTPLHDGDEICLLTAIRGG